MDKQKIYKIAAQLCGRQAQTLTADTAIVSEKH